jgi:hypothetical protein
MITALRGFLPWIGFGIVESALDWRAGALTALLLALAAFLFAVVRGNKLDALVIELSGLAFFVVLTPLAFLDPTSVVQHDTAAISTAWLALTAWGSMAVRKPFTLGIARTSAPREFWDRPEFLHVNNVITTVWSVAFTITAAGLQLWGDVTAVNVGLQIAGYALPMIFTIRYSEKTAADGRRQYEEAQAAQAAAQAAALAAA